MPQNWWDIYSRSAAFARGAAISLAGAGRDRAGPRWARGGVGAWAGPALWRAAPGAGPGRRLRSVISRRRADARPIPGSSPDQAPPIGYPQPPLAGDQAGPLSDRRLAVQQAAAAIRDGADPRAVRARLNQVGTDNPGFDPLDPFSDLLPGGQQGPGMMNPPQGPQPDAFSGDQPPFARNSMPGGYGPSGLAGGMAAQMATSPDPSNLRLPQGLLGSEGASLDRTGSFAGPQSGLDPRSYAAAYAQNPSDALPANQLGVGFNGNGYSPAGTVSDIQAAQPADDFVNHMRAVVNSLPPDPADRAQPLPPEQALSGTPSRIGDDGAIVVTGPRLADREAPRRGASRSTLSGNLERFAGALSLGEGGYESYNTGNCGIPGGRVPHSFVNRPVGTVTGRTINEILRTYSLPATDPRRMFAVGRYQITHNTLMDAVRHMHLSGNERLTPELQDRIFAEFLVRRRPALAKSIFNGVGSADDAQYAARRNGPRSRFRHITDQARAGFRRQPDLL